MSEKVSSIAPGLHDCCRLMECRGEACFRTENQLSCVEFHDQRVLDFNRDFIAVRNALVARGWKGSAGSPALALVPGGGKDDPAIALSELVNESDPFAQPPVGGYYQAASAGKPGGHDANTKRTRKPTARLRVLRRRLRDL